jgi:hypothetical protein
MASDDCWTGVAVLSLKKGFSDIVHRNCDDCPNYTHHMHERRNPKAAQLEVVGDSDWLQNVDISESIINEDFE